MDASTTGAKTELIAATYLLTKGYHVFRALSPSCFCDLIAVNKTEMVRVEVKTGYFVTSKSGAEVHYAFTKEKADNFDLLIVITYDKVNIKMAVFERSAGVEDSKGRIRFAMPISNLLDAMESIR
jgi:hypothetical protein